MLRNTQEVLENLKGLIRTPGYIYSLCLILHDDFYLDINKIHEVNHRAKLSVKECSLIVGILVQNEIDFSFPMSPEITFERKEQTYRLMEELHFSFMAPQIAKFRDMFERQQKGEVFEDSFEARIDFFVKDGAIIEPMFYSGDGIYDFQYLEYLEAKYKYDTEWLLENRGFDISLTRQIVGMIKKLALKKSETVLPINIREDFPKVAAMARKKLKRQKLTKEKINEIEREHLISTTFYKYIHLFPSPETPYDNREEGWRIFYQNLLELFIIRPSDLSDINLEAVEIFFDNFSFVPPTNENFEGPGYYNILNSNPLVKLDNERYFLPIGYLLPEATYESPFYWMWDDSNYRDRLAKHRGDVGEEIAFELLCKVFGKENTYRSVLIETKKGKIETDIDVLCILGNKALCVQVKSKKLTLAARRGDFEQLSKDFKGAVQDAYDQGLVSRNAILMGNARFVGAHGDEINLSHKISEVYIMGLTTENYSSLVHQVHTMLVKKPDEPHPLFLSVFDLELLAHYLKDPYDFLYYVRQRTALMEYFRADEELIYLGYHLQRKLWPIEGADFVGLETDFGGIIDRNYYPFKTGISHLLPEKDDPIANGWKDPLFDSFINEIKSAGRPTTTDIIFQLFDWSGDARNNIVTQFQNLKQAARSEGKVKSVATGPASSFGLSYVVIDDVNLLELNGRVVTYAQLRKYVSKCDTWLGIGSFSISPHLVDTLIYLDEPWEHDPELETTFSEELAKIKSSRYTPTNRKGKISRNDPCPCQSGKKFKKCCGTNF